MPYPTPPRPSRAPRPRGRLRAALVASLALAFPVVALPVLAGPAAVAAPGPRQPGAGTDADVLAVQTNMPMRMPWQQFQADLRRIFALDPDFITYNEVSGRYDSVLAPEGYAVHRDRTDRYTGATAVAWNTDRWTEVRSGTTRISNVRRIPPGWDGRLGLRYANWVTLESATGRRVSVVAVHVAPVVRGLPDLLRPSVTRLGSLAEELAPSGPVLVGGDFNVHYRSGRYPRDLLDAAGLEATYDTLGSSFPTGNHFGYTIDYLMNRAEGLLAATSHRPMRTGSDHDAVVAGFDWLEDLPGQTTEARSDPTGDGAERRLAVVTLLRAITAQEAGDRLDLVTSVLRLRRVYGALRAAVGRGVQVHVTTRSKELTPREQRLAALVGSGRSGDAAGSVQQCRSECLKASRSLPRTLLLVRDESGRAVLRTDLNRNLDEAAVQRRTRVVTRVGAVGLAEGERLVGLVS